MKAKVKRKKNLGKVLDRTIKKLGLKKYKIAELLKIQRPTLNSRLVDGKFTEPQLKKLREAGYLEAEV